MRSGAWQKMRVNQGQELVIGGYTPSAKNFDALVIGYYDGDKLMYAARTRNGFTPASRVELFKKLRPLESMEYPFTNLPEKRAGRGGTPETFRFGQVGYFALNSVSRRLPALFAAFTPNNLRECGVPSTSIAGNLVQPLAHRAIQMQVRAGQKLHKDIQWRIRSSSGQAAAA